MHPQNVIIGVRRDVKRWLLSCFLSYTTIWSFLEPAVGFLSPNLGASRFLIFLFLAVSLGTYWVWPKKEIAYQIPNTGTTVSIGFGDIFATTGCKVIAVNDFFDSEIGDLVSPNSLHGYFIQKILGGHAAPFDEATKNIPPASLINSEARTIGKTNRFKLGTAIEISHGSTKFFLFAFSKTDQNLKAYSSPVMMLEALEGLWDFVRLKHGGEPVVVPLLGSKLSGVGLGPTHLIDLIIISIIRATKTREVAANIKIVLQQELFEEIDLNRIEANWRKGGI